MSSTQRSLISLSTLELRLLATVRTAVRRDNALTNRVRSEEPEAAGRSASRRPHPHTRASLDRVGHHHTLPVR